ncbi:AMP-binding protein [Shewanella surugensis]|uniref:AMP-binding protein n=1 Tax=Shewanella surugensis TaxID=212020 RepID=A0ABT0L6N4_9GAMM|nr:amino acid adenylation domain-containing protein [Shewanella surugensis]MCL1123234.1 AMP-binding protein [Shewanella surugensis]
MGFLSLTKIIDKVSMEYWNDTAVIDVEQSITYGELKVISERIACYFLSHSQYTQGGLVLVNIEKCVYLPAVLLGILKAGLAYIPLSTFHTFEQMTSIALDSNAFILLTDNKEHNIAIQDELALATCCLDEVLLTDANENIAVQNILPDDLAYILYTSGSTGKPKGVMIEHGQLAYYSQWFASQDWGERSACLPFTSAVSFAAAVSQIFYSLLRGEPLHILPEDCLRTPKVLLTWYQQHPNAALYCVPTIWRELLAFFTLTEGRKAEQALPNVVLLSGEAVPENLKEESFQRHPKLRLYNLYGPTETTANATFCELYPNVPVHLGLGIEGTEIQLLDEERNPVAEGEIGEIYIAGEGVARGYLNDLDRTQARFCSLLDGAGKSVWAHGSGDLAQINSAGQLKYLGRKDSQMKLHGIRFEAEEIEQAISLHVAVASCIIDIHHNENGIQCLVAYVVKDDNGGHENIGAERLRHFLSQKLARSLIPSHFIFLTALPKLANGKVDKSSLPKPNQVELNTTIEGSVAQGVVPVSAEKVIEQALIDIWQQVLECQGIGVHDNIMALGANSLHLIRAQSLIQAKLGYRVHFNQFFEYSTPRALSAQLPLFEHVDHPPMALSQSTVPLLTSEQQYFITLDLFSENTDYQIYFYQVITGSLDKDRLTASIHFVLKRHPVLLTRINLDKKSLLDVPFRFDDIKINENEASLAQVQDEHWLRERAQSVCSDIEVGPLIHLQLLRISLNHHVLLVTVHHAVFDRESISLWSHQLIEHYKMFKNEDFDGSKQPVSYQEYANWQYDFMQKTGRQDALDFWGTRLQCDFDNEVFINEGINGASYYSLFGSLYAQKERLFSLVNEYKNEQLYIGDYTLGAKEPIERYAQQHKVTVPLVLLAAFYYSLRKIHAGQQCQVGIPVSNRARGHFKDTLGCFVNIINFCVEDKGTMSFIDFLQSVRESFFERLRYSYISYSELVDYYRQEYQSAPIAFLAGFNYLSQLPSLRAEDTHFLIKEIQSNTLRQGISLTIEEQQGTLAAHFVLDVDQYNPEEIKKMINIFEQTLIEAIYH